MVDREMTSDSIWDRIEGERVCMLASSDENGVEAKPMTPYCRRSEGTIWFVTDRRSHVIDDKGVQESVSLIFQDSASNFYATIKGTITVVDSQEKVSELWNPLLHEFFDGPGDRRIICVAFEPLEANYCTGPGRVASAIKLA
jgi:general stress protein 26